MSYQTTAIKPLAFWKAVLYVFIATIITATCTPDFIIGKEVDKVNKK